tara:strand:- start:1444 stop:3996 length:2553 start_codon:yes stop_codon:yes gene_type:complete
MALTQISTEGIKNGTITGSDLATNVDLVDNQKIRFGTGNDLEIVHNSSENHFIVSQNTFFKGNIFWGVRNSSNQGVIEALTTSRTVDLYGGSTKVLSTSATGVTIRQGFHIQNSEFNMTTNGTKILDFETGGTNSVIFRHNPSDASLSTFMKAIHGGAVELYHDGDGNKKFETTTNGVRVVNIPNNQGLDLSGTGNNTAVRFMSTGSSPGHSYRVNFHSTTGGLFNSPCLSFDKTATNGDFSGHIGAISDDGFHLADDKKLHLGGKVTSGDFQIYHDGSASYIDNTHSGGLYIRGGSSTGYVVALQAKNSENSVKCIGDGAVELYHDGSKKLNTESFGVDITGILRADELKLAADNQKLRIGSSADLEIFHDGTDSKIYNSSATPLKIQNVGSNGATVHIQARPDEEGIKLLNNSGESQVELYYDGNKKFHTISAGATITGRLEIDRGSSVEQAIDIKTTGTTSASRIRFLESGTLKAQVAYSHGEDQIEIVGNAGQKAAFFTNGNQRLFIDTSGNIGFNRTNTNAGDSQTQASVATPNRVVFNNQYSNGYTDNSLKVYLFNDGATRQGFTSGPQYDIQYHSSGHSTLTKHSFYTANTERLRINSDTNGRYLGRTPLNPAESAEEIKNDVSGTPDNDWYYIKQFGNVARLHYCVFKDKNGNDIAGGPWTMNWVAGVHPNQFSTNGSTALGQYLNLCKGIGIDKPGRGMENSRTTTQVYGAWLAVKRALWDLDPGFFEGASAASGGVLLMPLLNSNGEGGSSAHRLVYATGTATHIPPNQDGDHCNASQLFCGWWGGNDFSSWATDNNSVPSPEDWGPQDAAHTGNIGAKSNSTTQKPSWRDLMLVTCIYK